MKTENPSRAAIEEAVRRAGSQAALARLLGKSQPHIHKWLNSPNALRPEHCLRIEQAVGVTRRELRPNDWREIWPEMTEVAYA